MTSQIMASHYSNLKSHVSEKVAEAKVGFSSGHNLYVYLQTKEHNVEATYNEDLLPSPPGQ